MDQSKDDYNYSYIDDRKKPVIPPLPRSEEEWRVLMKRSFKILKENSIIRHQSPGLDLCGLDGTAYMLVKCPFCGMIFQQTQELGGFAPESPFPHFCPNCHFPDKNGMKSAYSF